MATVRETSGGITASGAIQDEVTALKEPWIDLVIEGTFVATIDVQRSAPGGNWTTFQTYSNADAPVNVAIRANSPNLKYRLNASAYTSGTANYFLGSRG